MEVVHEACAGLDVHQESVVACARVVVGGKAVQEVATFETTTQGLLALCDWLGERGVGHVAMESTGVYWKPVWHVLESSFELVLANAGLLEGKKATTWWGMREQLSQLGDIEVVEDTRFVDQSPIITAAGVSAGIDMALYLAGKLWGPERARLIQKYIEYFPDPAYADVPIPEPSQVG